MSSLVILVIGVLSVLKKLNESMLKGEKRPCGREESCLHVLAGSQVGRFLFTPNDWNTECPKESQREEIRRREEAMQMRRRPPACFGCMPVQGPQVGCTLVIGGLSAWRGLQWKMLEGEKRLCR